MARILAVSTAQGCVESQEYRRLGGWQQQLWLALLVACQTPGIPLDDTVTRAQLVAIWGSMSTTYRRLLEDGGGVSGMSGVSGLSGLV